MKNNESNRKTYAQEKLIKIIAKRELGKWCQDRNLEHSTIYRIAIGENVPTYRVICSMIDSIAPQEWVYFTDEKIPYPVKTLPRWNPDNPSGFIKKHRYDWKELAAKYEISQTAAYNIFVQNITFPSIKVIRKFIADVDPAVFFMDDEEIKIKLPPERGDIVNIEGINYFILSKNDFYKKNSKCIGALISNTQEGVQLKNDVLDGNVTITLKILDLEKINALYIGHVKNTTIKSVLSNFKNIIED